MLHRYLNHVAVLGGSLGLLILGTMPASAAMTTCPSGTPTYFTGSTVYLEPQDSNPNVWSSPVTLYAYCGSVDTGHALSNVAVTAVMASSTGAIPQLEASVDGTHFQTLTLGFPGTALTMPPNLVTNAAGMVQFTLYAQSPVRSFLAGPDGAPQLIGLQLDYGSSTVSNLDGSTYQAPVGGFGGIFAQTPELDSFLLFGSGAAGLASYGLLRLRAAHVRKQD